jgi:BirA family biotin operon repressor/biotin-[acetyl-CoA-carboxylase] ligase
MTQTTASPAWRVQRYVCLASTQDMAIAAAEAGDPGRLAILADTQTAGRGSRGRGWTAPAGNLNFSALLRPELPIRPGFWSLLAGVALYEALAPYADGLMLKWPNDLLFDGAKLGGILIDASGYLVIGIGANLAVAPSIAGRRTARLPVHAPDPGVIADRLVCEIERYGALSLDTVIEAWLARAHPLGTPLDIHTPKRRLRGSFAGLTETGCLRINGCAEAISSAEVFVGTEAPG